MSDKNNEDSAFAFASSVVLLIGITLFVFGYIMIMNYLENNVSEKYQTNEFKVSELSYLTQEGEVNVLKNVKSINSTKVTGLSEIK